MDLFVSPEDLAEAAKASSFLFTIPDDAARKGDPNKGGSAAWAQSFAISGVKMEAGTTKDKSGTEYPAIVVEMGFDVPVDATRAVGGSIVPDVNAGRSMKQWYYLVPEAAGNKEHPKYKAHYFALGKLKSLLSSAGFSVPDAGFSLKAFFGTQDILLGQKINTLMKRSWYEMKAKDEISDFISVA